MAKTFFKILVKHGGLALSEKFHELLKMTIFEKQILKNLTKERLPNLLNNFNLRQKGENTKNS